MQDNTYIPPTLRIEVIILTPERARAMVHDLSEDQRRARAHRVDKLAAKILAGKWRLNGATVVLDNNNRVVDGQHRLLAVIKANLPIAIILVRGVEDVFGTIDDTLPRSAEDWLRKLVAGEANARQISAAIAWCWRYESRMMARGGTPTLDQQVAYLTANPGLIESYRKLLAWKIGRVGRSLYPLLTFTHYQCAKRSPAQADAFFESVASGRDMSGAAHALRERFLTERNKVERTKTPYWALGATILKAWNYYRAGIEELNYNHMRFRTGGDAPEAFPVAR
jgi:hypothetical protein